MISTQVDESIAVVTIDRRDVHNALDQASLNDIESTIRALSVDPGVAVIILTGAGERSFVAGGDLRELSGPQGVAQAFTFTMQSIFDLFARCPKPTIAAVNGMALGGGLELALACDIRIASTNATFALPELTWSMLPAAGGITRLTRVIGSARALEMVLTGRRADAAEALAMGLVTTVVDGQELLDTANTLAATIRSKAPLAVRIARLAVQVAEEAPLESSLIAETIGLAALYGTHDQAEGMLAFVEKRPAQFKGQ